MILKSDHIVQVKDDFFITNEKIDNINGPKLVIICELASCNLYEYINNRYKINQPLKEKEVI